MEAVLALRILADEATKLYRSKVDNWLKTCDRVYLGSLVGAVNPVMTHQINYDFPNSAETLLELDNYGILRAVVHADDRKS
jgi:hypothetical protein